MKTFSPVIEIRACGKFPVHERKNTVDWKMAARKLDYNMAYNFLCCVI